MCEATIGGRNAGYSRIETRASSAEIHQGAILLQCLRRAVSTSLSTLAIFVQLVPYGPAKQKIVAESDTRRRQSLVVKGRYQNPDNGWSLLAFRSSMLHLALVAAILLAPHLVLGQSQTELNQQSYAEFQKAEKQLNETYV